jgi:serine phosphatase RsbU (regulator of sigma subunit)
VQDAFIAVGAWCPVNEEQVANMENPETTIQLHLMVVADVAGKGLASAIVASSFRSAMRSLASQLLPLDELAARLSQQHWEEGTEAQLRYVTAVFLRLHAELAEIEIVNAGHRDATRFPSTPLLLLFFQTDGTHHLR